MDAPKQPFPEHPIWVFHGTGAQFASGIFQSVGYAESWIRKWGLSGVLTVYPLDEGAFDWALRTGAVDMKPETAEKHRRDSTKHQTYAWSPHHRHYEKGERTG